MSQLKILYGAHSSQDKPVAASRQWMLLVGEEGGKNVYTDNISAPLVSKYSFTTRCSIVIIHIALNIKEETLNFPRKWTTKSSKFCWRMLLQMRPDYLWHQIT